MSAPEDDGEGRELENDILVRFVFDGFVGMWLGFDGTILVEERFVVHMGVHKAKLDVNPRR